MLQTPVTTVVAMSSEPAIASRVLVCISCQSVTLALALQRRRVDAERTCRELERRCARDDAGDVLALERFDRNVGAECDLDGGRRARDRGRDAEIVDFDARAGAEDDRALHGIAQLSQIAWPGV